MFLNPPPLFSSFFKNFLFEFKSVSCLTVSCSSVSCVVYLLPLALGNLLPLPPGVLTSPRGAIFTILRRKVVHSSPRFVLLFLFLVIWPFFSRLLNAGKSDFLDKPVP